MVHFFSDGLSASLALLQVWVLAIRNCRMYLRNPELMLAKLFTYIFMGAFMGEHVFLVRLLACFLHVCIQMHADACKGLGVLSATFLARGVDI